MRARPCQALPDKTQQSSGEVLARPSQGLLVPSRTLLWPVCKGKPLFLPPSPASVSPSCPGVAFGYSAHCRLAMSMQYQQLREGKQAPRPSSGLVFPEAGQRGPALCALLAWLAARKSELLHLERLSRDWKLSGWCAFKWLSFPKLIRGLLCKSPRVYVLNRITIFPEPEFD